MGGGAATSGSFSPVYEGDTRDGSAEAGCTRRISRYRVDIVNKNFHENLI